MADKKETVGREKTPPNHQPGNRDNQAEILVLKGGRRATTLHMAQADHVRMLVHGAAGSGTAAPH